MSTDLETKREEETAWQRRFSLLARSTPGLAATRLIALTGYGQESDRHRSRLAGIDHHLVKPVDVEQLRILLAS